MARVQFYGGPYDGKACELPFLPTLLIGETMDGDQGPVDGKFVVDTRVSQYIYQLKFPNGEDEPYEYQFRKDRPSNLLEWIEVTPRRP